VGGAFHRCEIACILHGPWRLQVTQLISHAITCCALRSEASFGRCKRVMDRAEGINPADFAHYARRISKEGPSGGGEADADQRGR